MNHFDRPYVGNRDAVGNVRVWKHSIKEGTRELIVNQPNMIVYSGADIAAKALSGQPNTGITHMYVGISSTNSSASSAQLTDTVTTFGNINTNFIRQPIAFSPSFSNETHYLSNLVYFSIYLTGSVITDGFYVNSLGLVNASVPTSISGDYLFSRITFTPIQYTTAHGLAVTWGITFRAQ